VRKHQVATMPSYPQIPPRWRYRRCIVVDGNFSAEHMKMKCPKDDVWLSNGVGYMVEHEPYQNHLTMTIEAKQVRS
jgi:hypothetical protein